MSSSTVATAAMTSRRERRSLARCAWRTSSTLARPARAPPCGLDDLLTRCSSLRLCDDERTLSPIDGASTYHDHRREPPDSHRGDRGQGGCRHAVDPVDQVPG